LTPKVDIESTLAHMAEELRPLLNRNPVIIGIHTGGAWVAARMQLLLNISEPLSTLDISFYRDDFTRVGMNPEIKASEILVDVDDRHVILVDDILHTGRTIRAAMNVIFDYGRPESITLAILIDRNERELPIQADVVGASLSLEKGQHVKLTGPDKLALVIQEATGDRRTAV